MRRLDYRLLRVPGRRKRVDVSLQSSFHQLGSLSGVWDIGSLFSNLILFP